MVFWAILLFAPLGYLNYITQDSGHYEILARSFLSGQLHFIERPASGWGDTAPFNGYYYWPLGPFPAVFAMPLVLLGVFKQAVVSFLFSLAAFGLCYALARKYEYERNDSLWLALAFVFGTSFAGVATWPLPWYFNHVIAATLLFAAIYEYTTKERPWLIGLAMGLVLTTRLTAGLGIVFFLIAATAKGAKTLLAPFAVCALGLAAYNYARFGVPWETGYTYQINYHHLPYSDWATSFNFAGHALLSLEHVPRNLAFALFALPSDERLGSSFLLASPYLLYLGRARLRDRTNQLIACTALAVFVAVLSFRNVGSFQSGYRFSLDFLPFVFWLLVRSQVQLTKPFKALIAVAIVINVSLALYFIATALDFEAVIQPAK